VIEPGDVQVPLERAGIERVAGTIAAVVGAIVAGVAAGYAAAVVVPVEPAVAAEVPVGQVAAVEVLAEVAVVVAAAEQDKEQVPAVYMALRAVGLHTLLEEQHHIQPVPVEVEHTQQPQRDRHILELGMDLHHALPIQVQAEGRAPSHRHLRHGPE